MHPFYIDHSRESHIRPREVAAALAFGAAFPFAAKYFFAAILIIFMLLGNR